MLFSHLYKTLAINSLSKSKYTINFPLVRKQHKKVEDLNIKIRIPNRGLKIQFVRLITKNKKKRLQTCSLSFVSFKAFDLFYS